MEVQKVAIVAGSEEGLVDEVGVGGRVFDGGGGGRQQEQEGKDVGVLLYREVMEEEDQEQVANMSLEVEKIGGEGVMSGRAEEMELDDGDCGVLRHVDGDENNRGSMEDMVMWRGKIEVCAEGGHVVVGSLDDEMSGRGEGFKVQEVDQDVMDDKDGDRRRRRSREVVEHGGDLGTDVVRFGEEKQHDGADRQQLEGEAETMTISPSATKGRGKTSRDAAVEWSDGATIVLLIAFAEKYRALERSNFTSKIWADIAAYVNARRGPPGVKGSGTSQWEGTPKTQEQCRIKVDNLKKRYKVEREKMLTSGITASKWPFFDTLDELVGSKPRHTRAGGGTGGSLTLGLENGQPLALQPSGEEGGRIFYLEARNVDQKPDTLYNLTPLSGRGKRKKALQDLERENVIAASLRALFEGFNIAGNIIDAMAHEEVDEDTLLNSRDVGSLLEKILAKHQLAIKLGPAERIKQAIEEAKGKKLRAAQ